MALSFRARHQVVSSRVAQSRTLIKLLADLGSDLGLVGLQNTLA